MQRIFHKKNLWILKQTDKKRTSYTKESSSNYLTFTPPDIIWRSMVFRWCFRQMKVSLFAQIGLIINAKFGKNLQCTFISISNIIFRVTPQITIVEGLSQPKSLFGLASEFYLLLLYFYQLTLFPANVPLLYPLKKSENQKFSHVFRGYRIGTLAGKRVKYVTLWRKVMKHSDPYRL